MAGARTADRKMNSVRSLLNNDYLILAVRLVLGMIFLIAAIDKTADPTAFASSIDNYRIFHHSISLWAATILPWLELLCAFALLGGIATRGGALLTFVMLLTFTAAVLSAMARGLDISCGCFTRDPGVEKIGWAKLGQNALMMLASLYLIFSDGKRFSIEALYRGRS